MSFGLEKDHDGMTEAILQAASKRIIMFAAASNNGGNQDVTFPARRDEVICIYSTDGQGNSSGCNPTGPKGSNGYHFATLGAAVKSAWPRHLPGGHTSKRMTGTSFSTPIAAAVAACILEFARMHRIADDLYKLLRSREGMLLVLPQMADKRDFLDYILPWKLFASYRTAAKILDQIQDPLEKRIRMAATVEDEVCD